jgi:hypothetical protein
MKNQGIIPFGTGKNVSETPKIPSEGLKSKMEEITISSIFNQAEKNDPTALSELFNLNEIAAVWDITSRTCRTVLEFMRCKPDGNMFAGNGAQVPLFTLEHWEEARRRYLAHNDLKNIKSIEIQAAAATGLMLLDHFKSPLGVRDIDLYCHDIKKELGVDTQQLITLASNVPAMATVMALTIKREKEHEEYIGELQQDVIIAQNDAEIKGQKLVEEKNAHLKEERVLKSELKRALNTRAIQDKPLSPTRKKVLDETLAENERLFEENNELKEQIGRLIGQLAAANETLEEYREEYDA